jgi:membrane-bound serine protease (ClpP class)
VLNNPWVTGLLMVIGLIALYVEVSSPGLSVGGLIALLCFALFFWSRFLGGTAEVLELVIFLVGILFLAAEIFVFPGFGVAGVTGLLLMGLGVLMASQTFVIPQTQRQFDTFSISLLVLACSALVFLVAAVVISRYFGSLPVFNRLVLQPATATGGAAGKPAKSQRGKPALDALPIAEVDVGVGDWGMALSALRPAGKARFGDEVLDVLTDGDFIEAGRQVRIVELEGNRIVVADVEHG